MKPGSVIMDLAAENGGNCELTQKDEIITTIKLSLTGLQTFLGQCQFMQPNFTQKNVSAFLTYMMKDGQLNLDLEDEIISGALYSHQGEITHLPTKDSLDKKK